MLHQMQSMTCCCSICFYLNAGCNPQELSLSILDIQLSHEHLWPERKSGLRKSGPSFFSNAFKPNVLLRLVLDCILDLEKEAEQMKLGAPLQANGELS